MRLFSRPGAGESNFRLFFGAIGDILMAFLRSLFSAFGMMLGGALVGGLIGGGAALAYGLPVGLFALGGAVVGFGIMALAIILLHAGGDF